MLIEHDGRRPDVHPSAYVAPTAVVSGDVSIGEDARILFGAVLTADGGPVVVGKRCIVMENALLRGRANHPVRLGDHVIVGPHAHVNGAEIGEDAFLATGVAIFPGARVGARAEIRIHGVVQVNTNVADDGFVPIGWVAVGDPAQVFPPESHDEIWAVQEGLDFPGTVFGVARPAEGSLQALHPEITARYAELFGRHRNDRVLDGPAA
jgi:carbonic anhydrase/acetyltransferase-like protein (isoleucine patch superfamily)